MIADLAKAGDSDAKAIFDESAARLGMGLSLLIDILNPERIILGGIYTRCEELFKDGMNAVLGRETLPESLGVCKILPAILGESIGDIAALAVADSIE
jgi:glucokinase